MRASRTSTAVRRSDGRPARPADADQGATGLALALRVPVFAALTLTLAVGAHTAGGGPLPDPGRLLFAVALVAFTWWPLTLREMPGPLLAAGVGAGQVAVHLVLLDPPGSAAATHPAHLQHGGTRMLVAHAVAAALVAVWLARGEAAVWAAVRRVLPGPPCRQGAPAVPARLQHTCTGQVPPLRSALLRRTDPHRGPPTLASA